MVPKQVVPDRRGLVEIGKIKENLVTEVAFDCADLGDGSGAYAVVFQRPKDAAPYPVAFRAEWPSIVWVVKAADTAKPGTGKVEIRWYGDGDQVGKSKTYMVRVTDGLPDPTEAPEAWEGFMGQVAQNAQAAQTAAGEAKANADGAAASAGIAQDAAAEAGKLAGAAGDAANAAASAASAASRAQAGAETAGQNARAAAEAAETARSGAEAAKLSAAESATGAAGSAETAAQAAQKGENLYNQVKDDLAAGKLKGEKGEKGDPGKDAPQIDDGTISRDSPWSSRRIIETLCPPIAETGNPVTCYPVAGYPLGVVASWEPTQAGSGEPYPAGGGPQLLDISRCTATVGKPYGLTITIDGDIIKCSGVPSEEVTITQAYSFTVATSGQEELRGKGYNVTAWPIKGKVSNAWGLRTADESSLAIAAELSPGVDTDIQLRLMVSKDTPTSYAPYENIRPISGRDSVSVEQCGENLLQIAPFDTDVYKGVTFEYVPDGGVRIQGTASANVDSPIFPIRHLPPGKYYGLDMDTGIAASIVVQRAGKNLWLNAKGTFEIIKGDIVKYWYIVVGAGNTVNTTAYPYIVPGTTAPTAYSPYQGDTLDLQLPETVYGGSVDAVRGEGAETWKLETLDGNSGIGRYRDFDDTDTYKGFVVIDAVKGVDISRDAICSHFKRGLATSEGYHPNEFVAHHPSGHLYLRTEIPGVTSVETFKAYLAAQYAAGTPVQIAYKLAEPVAFQATGNGPIMPLDGETNTIMTDADSVTITGRADPAHAITALQAQLAVATQALAETQQAMVDTTAMAVDYIYQQDLEDIGLEEEVDDSDNQTNTEPVDVPGV